jgi:hypothetical protein
MKIGPVIVAVVMLGASAMQASFAEDAASTAGHPEGANLSAEPSRSAPPPSDAGELVERAKPDNHAPMKNATEPKSEGNASTHEERGISEKENLKANVDGGPKGDAVKIPTGEGPRAVAKGVDPLDAKARAGDAGAIDTRITVQSSRPRNTHDKTRDAKSNFKISTLGSNHARRMTAPEAVKPIARNAIGLPFTQHEGVRERSDEPHGAPVQSSAHESPGFAASGAGNLAKTDGGLERPAIARPSPSPIVSAPVAQRGTINGAGLTRPSSAPSGVGGPAKVVVGINATNLRPKH